MSEDKDRPHGPVSERFMRHHYGARRGAPDPPDPIEALRVTVETLIAWMVQSANSPIRMDEAQQLLAMLPKKREKV